jgi:hypothetical protein
MIDILLGGLFALLTVLVGVGIIYYEKLLRILKERHTSIWRSLGSPTLLMNNTISNQKLMMAYINKKDYLNSKDQELIRLASFLRFFYKLYIAFFILIFITFLLLILRSN